MVSILCIILSTFENEEEKKQPKEWTSVSFTGTECVIILNKAIEIQFE